LNKSSNKLVLTCHFLPLIPTSGEGVLKGSPAQFTKPVGGGNAFISANLAEHDSKLKCHWTKRGSIKGWSQDLLVTKMQLLGIYITRDILANIETLRSTATDKQIVVFAEVFGVPVGDLFPPKQKSSGRIVGLNR
jgi:hypothetical protein